MDAALVTTIVTILMDFALGGMAFKLARSLEKTQVVQTAILTELSRRVDILEKK